MDRTWQGWIKAFTIFAKYAKDDERALLEPVHDQIMAGPDPTIVSDEDKQVLKELGWHVCVVYGCFLKYI